MNNVQTLPTTPLEHPAMDYAYLRQEGIRLIQEMAGEVWTDFNAHDPGITILEQLCYALTDLGYRINYDLPDLLAGEGIDPYESLYGPAEILSTEPVTLLDLRKLVMDVAGVKNAWIEAIEKPTPLYFHEGKKILSLQSEAQEGGPQITEPVFLKGLYRVLIESSGLVDEEGAIIEQAVARRLNAHRGLCEDFDEINVLAHQDVAVLARIEIGAVEDAGEVLSQIYLQISNYFSPTLPFKTLTQMLESGASIDTVFEGPLLERGFLDTKALAKVERRDTLYISDLIREIMRVPGVRAVRDISLKSGETIENWSLQLGEKQIPKLVFSAETIILEKAGMAASIDHEWVKNRYSETLKNTTSFPRLSNKERALSPPKGRDRNLAHYFSVQQHFPDCYGIGEMALPDSASPSRKAKAAQLKAYLFFFDQLLANYFSQLAHAKSLFSFYGKSKKTYFSQMITDPTLGLDGLLMKSREGFSTQLQNITDKSAGEGVSLQRKNRFLNHLMARFSEEFSDYALILFSLVDKGREASLEKLVQDKQAYLQHYPKISNARGRAFDALKEWDNQNVSGLESRVRLKLAIDAEESEDLFLIEHILLRPLPGDTQQQVPLLAAVQSKDPYSLQISFVFPDWPRRFKQAVFKKFIHQTIREETPAHLIAHVHWLDKTSWLGFEAANSDWLAKRRLHLRRRLGL